MELGPGSRLGNYSILRSLGSGGMADVFEAKDTTLDRNVALKVLPIEYCRNPQLVARFQKEVRAAAKLNHRNIVTVFEVGQAEQYHYFSMRLLTGGDLRRRIDHGLTPVEALAILRELGDAFAHAHARGFVHRDVKPENVMFDEQGFPVLTDFGIAKALDAATHMTRTGMTMGTPRYLAPEQASGKGVDARADLYSLGVIFYEMLTGRPPYEAEDSMAMIFKHVTEPVPQLTGDLIRMQPLLDKLMAKDVKQRFASAEDLLRAIEALGAPPAGSAHPAGGGPRPSQIRTAENALVRHLLTPSPLRTPAPKTPRPVHVPREAAHDAGSGEIAIAPPAMKHEAPARMAPARAAAAPPAAAPATGPQARDPRMLAAVAVVGIAAVTAAVLILREPRSGAPPEQAAAPAAASSAAQAQPDTTARADEQRAEQARKEAEAQAAAQRRQAEQAAASQDAARLEAQRKARADAEAQRKARADAEAQRKAQAEADAQRKAQAEAEARRKAQADAEAQRKAQAEAEARRKAQADAEAQRRAQADAEAQRKAQAEAEVQHKTDAAAAAAAAATAARQQQEYDAAARVAREKANCAMHVSALSASGKLTYEDVKRMRGARLDPASGKVRTPPVPGPGGREVIFEVTPDGCVKVKR